MFYRLSLLSSIGLERTGVDGADPEFLERWFIYIKVCVCGGGGVCFADFI